MLQRVAHVGHRERALRVTRGERAREQDLRIDVAAGADDGLLVRVDDRGRPPFERFVHAAREVRAREVRDAFGDRRGGGAAREFVPRARQAARQRRDALDD